MPMTVAQFEAELEAGAYAWPGGYPKFFIMKDGEALSFEAANQEKQEIISALNGAHSDWTVEAVEINWEDENLICCHTNKKINSAYGDA